MFQGRVEDLDNPSYFWRAHTVTVLLGLIGCLVYTSLIGTSTQLVNLSTKIDLWCYQTQRHQSKTPLKMGRGALLLPSFSGSHWVKSNSIIFIHFLKALGFWGHLYRILLYPFNQFILSGMTIMPDGPFLRPHPAIWRLRIIFQIFY